MLFSQNNKVCLMEKKFGIAYLENLNELKLIY